MTVWAFACILFVMFSGWVAYDWFHFHDRIANVGFFWVAQTLLAVVVSIVGLLIIESTTPLKGILITVLAPIALYLMIRLDRVANPPPTVSEIEQRERKELEHLKEKYPD